MKIASISGKLQAGFLAVAGIGAIVGAIALVALDRVGDATSRLVRDELPIAESTDRTHVAALNIVGSVRLFLASRDGLGARRDGVARDLKQLDASLDALAAVIERTRRDDLSGAVHDLRREARQLAEAGAKVMQSHERLTAYGFTFDERVYTVVTFGHFLRAQLARWISDLGDAARFDAPFKHSLDMATTSFERWRAQYQTSDADLAKLLDGHARTNAAIHADAKRIQEADGTSAKASHFERARARNFGRAERELDAIIEHAGKATLALEREAGERLAALDVIAARIVTRLTELTDSVGKRVATMSGDAIALGSTAKIVGIIAVVIGLSVSALLATMLGRGLARPLASLRNVMERLTQGDLSVDVPGRDRADEIGAMARSVDLLKASALERQTLAAAAEQEQASRLERAKRIEMLTARFEESASRDVRLATEAADNMLAVASEMSGSATQTNQHVGNAASATSAASADASTIAAALTEFSASIQTITSSVEGSSQVVRQAVEEVARTGETFSALSEGASRIGEVVRLISSIAGQTNLLALNAAIEAARAGEAGKGFAVVAGEVKALASQTARATEDIARQIAAIQGAAADAVTAMDGIGQTIGKLDAASVEISQSVAQQGQTTAELSLSTNNAATSVDNAARAVDAVKERAQETHELARSVTAAGEVLRGTAADLGRRIGEFTTQIKAA